jgi:hypothetical protein
MFGNRHLRCVSIATLALGTACAGHTTAPKGWLPKPQEAQQSAYGGWIELTYLEGTPAREISGELIAVSADSVWVLTEDQGLVIPTAAVRKGKLAGYAARSLAPWTLAGTLSTASNGAFLIFTMPMWIIGGTLANRSESGASARKTPPLQWAELAPFARFPQGFPEGLELSGLSRKKGRDPAKR